MSGFKLYFAVYTDVLSASDDPTSRVIKRAMGAERHLMTIWSSRSDLAKKLRLDLGQETILQADEGLHSLKILAS